MKLVSGLMTIIAVAASGFACGALVLAYLAPEPAAFVAPEPMAAAPVEVADATELPTVWPAVFGVVPPSAPEPEPEPVQEPEPVVVEEEPEENTTYYLTGLVAGLGKDSGAMISENDRSILVRIGDTLVGGEVVQAIDARGVWIEYEGERQLIPMPRLELDHLVSIEAPAVENLPPTPLLAEVTIPMEAMDRRFIERSIAAAGRLEETERENASGMDIVWIERGALFEQIGLRTGDTILSVNGKTLQTDDLLADMPDAVLMNGTLQLEILRDGTRQMVKVTLDQG